MPSQRHLIYLLPRADPDELQEGTALPCTCSYPLQLKIRIPPKPSSSRSDTFSRHSDRAQNAAFSPSSSASSSSRSRSTSSASSITVSPARLSSSTSSSSRASKHQIATWKLLAPQIKTISSTSNSYLLSEAFPGITSASLQQFPEGKHALRRESGSSISFASSIQDLKFDTTSSCHAQACSPTTASSHATDAASSPTSPASTNNTSPRQAFASSLADTSAPTTNLSTIQESILSEEANLTPAGSPATQLHPIITTAFTPLQRTFSSSTISSLPTMSRAGSLNGSRRVPAAYRKEMESVLFAQTAVASSSSPSSANVRSSINAGGYSVIPTLTSSIFSMNSADELNHPHSSDTSSSVSSSHFSSMTTSPASSMGNASISSIPFLDDAPTLMSKPKPKHGDQDDLFSVGGHNSNVVHVNDLGWYLEKVLWKLGLHRKGRKEFMSYWLTRFSSDDYVALRFLRQDEIQTFAPIEISIVSPSTSTAIPTLKSSMPPASLVSSISPPLPALSRPIERRRSSEDSASSASASSTIAHELDDLHTCSSLSSRSTSDSTNTTSETSTPPSEVGDSQNRNPPSVAVTRENPYSFHRIHVLFQRLEKEDIALFQYRVRYKSGSSTLGVIDWNEVDGISPSEDSKREDRPRVLHVSATDLGRRGLYFT